MKRTAFALSVIFLLLGSAAFAFQMQSGYYVGSGVSRSIVIENGFQPDLVIIKADTALEPVWRSSAMSGDSTAYFSSATSNTTNAITSLNSNGFSLGTTAVVNSANVRYTWTAFSGSGGVDFRVGSYIGNGIDNTNQDILGFQPDVLWIKSSGAAAGCWRTSSLTTFDATLFFAAANQLVDYIQAFRPSGFQVGLNAAVNTNTVTYYYAAFKNVTGSCTVGAYTGNGADNRSISGLGFNPDLVILKQGISAAAQIAQMRSNQNYGDETHSFTALANVVNKVQSLESDGFQVGTDLTVNASGTTEYFAAFAGVPASPAPTGSFVMANGQYNGDLTPKSISGLGFAPNLVIIKGGDANYAVFTTSMMAPNTSAYLANAALNITTAPYAFTSLGNDGFSIGTNATVNNSGTVYDWIAFGNSGCADFKVGAYTGVGNAAGSDNRSIAGVGFMPDLVAIKGNVAQVGVWRTSNITGDSTAYFHALANAANIIQTMEASGFQIGNNNEVMTAATAHFYFAFKNTTEKSSSDSYSGTGVAQSILKTGFQPQLVWVKGNVAQAGALRDGVMTGPACQFFTNTANAVLNITSMESTGFTVGTDNRVNQNTILYNYYAWHGTASPSKLGFKVQPSNTASGVNIMPAIKVAVQDPYGQIITCDNSTQITVTIESNPSGGTLSGTLVATASAGVATFSNLNIDNAGVDYKLRASAAGLTIATSDAFNITPANAAKLRIISQPANSIAGVNISPVSVEVLDASNNRVTADNSTQINFSILNNPGGGTLTGTASLTVTSGVATFDSLKIDKMGAGYTLIAQAAGLAPSTSSAFSISPAAANKLAFSVQPSSTIDGLSISPPVRVQVQDTYGNLIAASSAEITLAIQNNPGGGTLNGTKIKNAVSGEAVFNDLNINKTGGGYTLRASALGLIISDSNAFNITPAPATKLMFSAQPTSAIAGASISPEVVVSLLDANDNLVNNDSSTYITVAIQTNPGGGTLSGTLTKQALLGAAAFSDLSINRSGIGYTLTSTSTGLASAGSAAFNIDHSSASKLGFTVQPSQTKAGANISPEVKVAVQDTFGNTITADSTTNITVSIGANPSGGILSGEVTKTAASGIASFSDLNIDKTGAGYTLVATSGAYTLATSDAFNITPANSAKLRVINQPASAIAGTSISAVSVEVLDASNNRVTSDNTTQITFSIQTNPAGGTLSNGGPITVSSGVATFSAMSIDKAGIGYTLLASAGSLTPDATSVFNITPSSPSKLIFSVQPSTAAAGSSISPAAKVFIQDAFSNIVTSDSSTSVTMAIQNNPNGGTLFGTKTVTASSGVATFSDLSIDKTGTGYTLTATSGALTAAISISFSITPGSASKLSFSVQPATTAAGNPIAPAVNVAVQDTFGNLVSGDSTTSVTMEISSNPAGGTLSGTKTRIASNGIATFPDLSIDKVGTGYRLSSAAIGLSPATSDAFNITPGTAAKLRLINQPTNAAAGAFISPPVSVEVLDGFDNRVTSDNATQITFTIQTNPSGGTLSNGGPMTVSSGVAIFNTMNINKAGSGYTLLAQSGVLAPATTDAFNITSAAPNNLSVMVQPSSAAAGASITPAVKLLIRDTFGNIVTSDSSTLVTVAIQNNPSGGTLSGTLTRTAASGEVTFNDLSIDKVGTGYTLIAISIGLTPVITGSFEIAPAVASKLAFVAQPSPTAAGSIITPEVKVAVQDSLGNLITSDNSTEVTISIGSNPSGGTITGTLTRTVSSGIAAFSDLSIDKVGSGYTLVATTAAYTSATSIAFNVGPAQGNKLAFFVQPSNARAGTAITPEVKVVVEDRFGNMVTQDSTTRVTVSIKNNPGSGTLFGTKTVTAANGVVTFSDLYINKKGDGYTLKASSTGLLSVESTSFNVTGQMAVPMVTSIDPSSEAFNVPAGAIISISFDQVMDQPSVGAAFALKAIIDNNGGTIDAISVSGTASFDSSGKIFYFVPSSLSKGYTYQASIGTSALNSDLIGLSTSEAWDFTVIFDHSRPNTIYSQDRRARVALGAGTLPNDGYVLINRSPRSSPTAADPAKITLAINKVLAEGNPYHYPIQSSITEFNLFDANQTRIATRFAEAAILALYYDDANSDGIVDGTNPPIKEEALLLYRLDEVNGLWVRVPNCAVNLNENYVYAPIFGFSVYAIMSTAAMNVSASYVFPNPFKPLSGHTTMTFTNLASQCTIKIFNLNGDLVKTINESSGTGQNVWDVKNDSGEALQSGLYLYVVKTSSDVKTGKLVIIK